MDLTEDEKVTRGLLQFFLCADARRPSEDAPLKLKYRDLILTAYEVALKRKNIQVPGTRPVFKQNEDEDIAKGAGGKEVQALLQVSDVEESVDDDAEGPQDQTSAVQLEVEEGQSDTVQKTTAERVAEVVDATQAAEAAEAEVEAIMREEVLCRALLDPEGEARRRRIQARKLRSRKGLKWNFTGRAAKASNDRFREHEVDLESRRKLAFRSRRFRGQAEDQGDERQLGSIARQREVQKSFTAQKKQSKAQRHRPRAEKVPKRRRLPPIDFPELPILIADHEDQEMFPTLTKPRRAAPLAIQSQRNCRKARAQELEVLRESLTQELQQVHKERRDAARELCQSCVAEAEAVEELQKALTAAFGMVID